MKMLKLFGLLAFVMFFAVACSDRTTEMTLLSGKINTTVLSPLGGTYNVSNDVNLTINVTTGTTPDAVYANITWPNGTTVNVSLSNTTITWRGAYTIPNNAYAAGTYQVLFVSNNSGGYYNYTRTSFVAQYVYPYFVSGSMLPATGTNYTVNSNMTMVINATNGLAIDKVAINLTLPNGTVIAFNPTNTSGKLTWTQVFNITTTVGNHLIMFIANNTIGKTNTTTSTIRVFDNQTPAAYDAYPVSGSTKNSTTSLTFSINATDNGRIDAVVAQIRYPNGTINSLYLVRDGTTAKWNNTLTIPKQSALFNITFVVNDTANNRNNTVLSNFTARDINLGNASDAYNHYR